MLTDKIPPHDIDNEESCLGAILLGADLRTFQLTKDDFYSERNATVFAACQSLVNKGVSIDIITLAHELKDKLESVGGAAYLPHLVTCCPTPLNYAFYADIVSKLSFFRKLCNAAEQIAQIGYDAKNEVVEAVDKADELLLNLRKKVSPSEIITPKDKAQILMERYTELRYKSGNNALSTGLSKLDELLGGGFYPGTLNIIGSNTGVGKSTLLQNFANNMSKHGNVLYFSCEMGVVDLGDRDVAGVTKIPINTVRWGKYNDETFEKLSNAIGLIAQTNVYTYDKTPITTAKIMQSSLNLKLRHGLTAIIVDYLGLLDDDIGENRNLVLGYMTKRLKQIARQLEVPVLVAHQLSRDNHKREDKRPILPDLRESGHIEEDADTVIFIYRDNYFYDEATWNKLYKADNPYPENITELIVAKQRQGGSTGSNRAVRVHFDDKRQRFYDIDDYNLVHEAEQIAYEVN